MSLTNDSKISWVETVLGPEMINNTGNTFQLDFPLRQSAVESVAQADILDAVDPTTSIAHIFRGNRSV